MKQVVRKNFVNIEKDNKVKIKLIILLLTILYTLTCHAKDIQFSHITVDNNGPSNMHTKSIGDINGDGLIDLVVAGTDGKIYWYENPSLVKHVVTTSGGKWSTDAEVGDVNQDGYNDIIISDWYQNNSIVWWKNPGPSGSWLMYTIGNIKAHDIEIGDLDSDGDIDIVTRTQGGDGNKLELWRQDTPTSWAHRTLSCPKGEGLTLGDIDRDSDLDIIIGYRWYENTTNIIGGKWQEYVISNKWKDPDTFSALADINGDGRKDIVVTPTESAGDFYRISWFEAPPNPRIGDWTEHVIDGNIETVTHTLGTGDMDGDGDVDVVTAEMHQGADPDEVRVYINEKGDGTIWTKQVVDTTGSHNMRLVDFENDGDIDLFGANWSGTNTVDLWKNLSGPYMLSLDEWTYIEVDNGASRGFGLAMGDVTGNTYGDIVTGTYFYRNPGGNMLEDWTKISFPNPIRDALLILDVDGDTFGDVIAMDNVGGVYWVEAQDPQGTSWTTVFIGNVGSSDHGISSQGYVIAQLKAGGKPEIIIHSPDGMYYFEIPDTPEAGGWPRITITTNSYQEGIGVGDIDSDGDIDVCTTIDSIRVAWWENPGDGTDNWMMWEIGAIPSSYADRFYMGDLDGDSDLDIVVSGANGSGNGVYWFEQPFDSGSSEWTRHTIVNYGSTNTMNSMDVADMDNDGDIDIISGMHRGAREVAIWENDGTGTFTEHLIDAGKESHLGARVYDLDGDGDLDIVSICWDSPHYVHVWRNDAISDDSKTEPPTVVNFEDIAVGEPQEFISHGFRFTVNKNNVMNIVSNPATCGGNGCADNGTKTLVNLPGGGSYPGGPLTITHESGYFKILSVDVAEGIANNASFPQGEAIVFTGKLKDGSEISETFYLDGINDGKSPMNDFETFIPTLLENASLISLTISAIGPTPEGDGSFSIDNVIVVPQPSADVVVDFEDIPVGEPQEFISHGLRFTVNKSNVMNIVSNLTTCGGNGCADNGTKTLVNLPVGGSYPGGPLTITHESGYFKILSVDVAEGIANNGSFPEGEAVTFTGELKDGSKISETFYLDGINDGNGPMNDFETFIPTLLENASLISLTISAIGPTPEGDGSFSIDNVMAVGGD